MNNFKTRATNQANISFDEENNVYKIGDDEFVLEDCPNGYDKNLACLLPTDSTDEDLPNYLDEQFDQNGVLTKENKTKNTEEKEQEKDRFGYWFIKGLGSCSRYLLIHLKVDFDDVIYNPTDPDKSKPNWFQDY